MIAFYPPQKGPCLLFLFVAAGEPTGRIPKMLHPPSKRRPSRNDDLTLATLVVRVRPTDIFDFQMLIFD
jgi:hypothetical protein